MKKFLLSLSLVAALLFFAVAPASADNGPTFVNDTAQNGSTAFNVVSGTVGDLTNSNHNEVTDSVGAVVTQGSFNVSLGTGAQLQNAYKFQVSGIGAIAGYGDYNTAIGIGAQIGGTQGMTGSSNTGYGAYAGMGDANTAVGTNSHAGGGTTTGDQTIISNNNTAMGYGATAYGGNSVAIGAGSVANQPNTVSVGAPGAERRITNVAPGIYGTDAVNMNQLMGTESKINRLGATAMAMSGLAPMGYNPNQPTQFSAAIGTYSGDTGFALGAYHYTSEKVMLNAAIGFSNDGLSKEVAGRFGITWWAGPSKKDRNKVPDNTVVGTNVPDLKKQDNAPDKAVSNGSIVDRVNRLLGTSDSSPSAAPEARKPNQAESVPVTSTNVKVEKSGTSPADNIVDRVNRLLKDGAED